MLGPSRRSGAAWLKTLITINMFQFLIPSLTLVLARNRAIILNGQPLRCDWLNQCPAGSICELRPQHFPSFHVCYKAEGNNVSPSTSSGGGGGNMSNEDQQPGPSGGPGGQVPQQQPGRPGGAPQAFFEPGQPISVPKQVDFLDFHSHQQNLAAANTLPPPQTSNSAPAPSPTAAPQQQQGPPPRGQPQERSTAPQHQFFQSLPTPQLFSSTSNSGSNSHGSHHPQEQPPQQQPFRGGSGNPHPQQQQPQDQPLASRGSGPSFGFLSQSGSGGFSGNSIGEQQSQSVVVPSRFVAPAAAATAAAVAFARGSPSFGGMFAGQTSQFVGQSQFPGSGQSVGFGAQPGQFIGQPSSAFFSQSGPFSSQTFGSHGHLSPFSATTSQFPSSAHFSGIGSSPAMQSQVVIPNSQFSQATSAGPGPASFSPSGPANTASVAPGAFSGSGPGSFSGAGPGSFSSAGAPASFSPAGPTSGFSPGPSGPTSFSATSSSSNSAPALSMTSGSGTGSFSSGSSTSNQFLGPGQQTSGPGQGESTSPMRSSSDSVHQTSSANLPNFGAPSQSFSFSGFSQSGSGSSSGPSSGSANSGPPQTGPSILPTQSQPFIASNGLPMSPASTSSSSNSGANFGPPNVSNNQGNGLANPPPFLSNSGPIQQFQQGQGRVAGISSQCPSPDQVSTCEPCHSSADCESGLICCPSGKTSSCTAPMGSMEAEPRVIPLFIGSYEPILRMGLPLSLEMNGSVTLIRLQGQNILVDSGAPASKDLLVSSLAVLGLSTQDINILVITHGHLDHVSNVNLFPNSVKIVGKFAVVGNIFSASPLMTGNEKYDLCVKRVYVMDTPGHTPQDITLVIENVSGLGTVAVTGDLFIKDSDILGNQDLWRAQSWNATQQEENRRKVACLADWIIPGHGSMFKVTSNMKDAFKCAHFNGPMKFGGGAFYNHQSPGARRPSSNSVVSNDNSMGSSSSSANSAASTYSFITKMYHDGGNSFNLNNANSNTNSYNSALNSRLSKVSAAIARRDKSRNLNSKRKAK